MRTSSNGKSKDSSGSLGPLGHSQPYKSLLGKKSILVSTEKVLWPLGGRSPIAPGFAMSLLKPFLGIMGLVEVQVLTLVAFMWLWNRRHTGQIFNGVDQVGW